MPEFPEKKTTTTSGFNPNIPVWHSLSQSVLEKNGWVKVDKLYLKGEDSISYTGVHWILNGKTRIEFLEEINDKK